MNTISNIHIHTYCFCNNARPWPETVIPVIPDPVREMRSNLIYILSLYAFVFICWSYKHIKFERSLEAFGLIRYLFENYKQKALPRYDLANVRHFVRSSQAHTGLLIKSVLYFMLNSKPCCSYNLFNYASYVVSCNRIRTLIQPFCH